MVIQNRLRVLLFRVFLVLPVPLVFHSTQYVSYDDLQLRQYLAAPLVAALLRTLGVPSDGPHPRGARAPRPALRGVHTARAGAELHTAGAAELHDESIARRGVVIFLDFWSDLLRVCI